MKAGPDSDLAELGFLDAKETLALAAAGLRRVADLLMWLPRRYEDRRSFDAFPAQPGGPAVCIRGKVIDASKRHFGGSRGFYEILVEDQNGGVFGSSTVSCRWFNMPFIHRMILAGHEVILHGKPKDSNGKLVIDHPEFEIVRDDDQGPSIHLERIVPIYRNISGIAQRRLREIQHRLLQEIEPATLAASFDVDPTYPRHEAFREVHFPDAVEQAAAARRRFALEEFFALQLNVVWRRARVLDHQGRVLGRKTTLLKRFYENLPFDLTGAQKRSIKEILADLREARPMNRLLQGDVGSGKTFVAMAAMLLAVDSGCQAALMAPTQILAEQHYLTFKKWLEPLGVRVLLRTAAKEESSHTPIEGEPQILIGTHALLYDKVAFSDLGLVVIDEQHKFGVSQRSRLIEQGTMPDVLVMTATPIPRTLTMTIYGDLDVSVLDERPAGRGKMITALRSAAKQSDITKFVKEQLKAGRQAYLVYPLVEESDSLKAESATEAFAKWRKRLPGREVGMIHGKLPAEEKEEVMRRFRDGEIHALVATSVIEVGVDVPNANLMILHHAERFGLAQLHQLRGRIGRGEHKSYCILLTDGKSSEAMEKLAVMEKTADGFVIAEEDLRLRGPGDVLGTLQSGLGDLKFADFLADTILLREARALADEVIAADPSLTRTHASLRPLIHDEAPAASRRD
ncbi:MAG: ATP-dependent DNA helicase RecG [Verrucomicrobia bacterium]|nr:MAG: ATP-dependent DNA helicase RecG [Verrucomicrobiota bacterium]TAE88348.1 MAG: ATP-dependent DNA helicase RecG [Verrucomicrobiota bacterium]TAF26802.1 MAG: ATP-dependent DNA helicase RecG [Verrucomicrobiota bacterium]TAF42059.1 MAG: ATP-dependent DNA helicase RecG [Verrucomicrobiota bacterium]